MERTVLATEPDWLGLFDLSLLGELGLEGWLADVTDRCARLFGATGVSLFVETQPGLYRLRAQSGSQSTVPEDACFSLGEGIAGRTLLTGEPRIVDSPKGTAGPRGSGLCSSMIVPLTAPDGVPVGILNLSRAKPGQRFGEKDLKLASSVGSVVALAISNAGTFERLQAALERQAEAARTARLAEIGQMAASVAHEFRNPLTGIRGAAQMIRERPSSAPEFIGLIEEEAQKLEALCEDFLELARPLSVRPVPAKLGDAARSVAAAWKSVFDEKGVALRVRAWDDEPALRFDPRRIEQALHNLVRNAFESTPPGGSVTVTVLNGGLVVEDTGPGMSADVLERLFVPFFTTKPNGSGLGLCNVKRIVEAHDGTIGVVSRPGEGTRVELILDRRAS
jgi:signal transduction histidine kinase